MSPSLSFAFMKWPYSYLLCSIKSKGEKFFLKKGKEVIPIKDITRLLAKMFNK